ncbi:hypothetical protein [Glutamicibacter sp. NPDC087344]|uniref:hypothetical protein n=1 Tax=Glutamicibacter sp. NPDC087344 TaxID=3363994 RepID=UPI0037F81CFF
MQKSSRSTRALRGTAVAFFATFVSLGSHVFAGGAVPELLNVVLPLSLSVMLCILLSGRRFSIWRLAIMVGFSQVLFHLMFSMGSGHSSISAVGQGAHAHHQTSLAVDLSSSATSTLATHGDDSMVLAHLLAGIATIFVLRRSEQLLIVLSDFVQLFSWKLLWHLVSFGYRPVCPQPVPVERTESISHFEGVYSTCVIRRGPPVLAAV